MLNRTRQNIKKIQRMDKKSKTPEAKGSFTRNFFKNFPDQNNHVMTFLDIPALINMSQVDRRRNKFARVHLDERISDLVHEIKWQTFPDNYPHSGSYAERAQKAFACLYASLRTKEKYFCVMLHIGNTEAVAKLISANNLGWFGFLKTNYLNGIIGKSLYPDHEPYFKGYPLTIAVRHNHIELTNFLLMQPFDLKNKNCNGDYELPLAAAVRTGRKEIVDILLKQPAIKIQGNELDLAARNGFYDIAARLIVTGAEFKLNRDTVERLASKGDEKMLQMILPYDTANYRYGRHVIYNAAEFGHVGVLRVLHESKAYIRCGLHIACMYGKRDAVRYLLENKADANQRLSSDHPDCTLLHEVTNYRLADPDLVSLLLEHKAKVNVVRSSYEGGGNTALHYAARFGSNAAVKVLVENGADALIKNHKGQDAVDVAANDEIRQILLQSKFSFFHARIDKQRENLKQADTHKSADSKTTQSNSSANSLLDTMQLMAIRLTQPMTDLDRENYAELAMLIGIHLKIGQPQEQQSPRAALSFG